MKFFFKAHNSNNRSEVKELRSQFLESGLVNYSDAGYGIALLQKETIEKMLPSFIGCPVTINHVDGSADQILKSGKSVGKVTSAQFNPDTGWFDCNFTVEDEDALEKIKDGWSVSCAFDSDDTGPGGEHHALKYNFEIVDGHFTHLALVPNPRYEDSKIFANQKCFINSKEAAMVQPEDHKKTCAMILVGLNNSKENSNMFAFLKKIFKNADGKDEIKESKFNAVSSKMEIDGEQVPVSELISTYEAEQAEIAKKKELDNQAAEEEVLMENTVKTLEGKEYKIGDLIASHRNKCASKKNSEDEAKKKELDEKKAKENAEADEKAKKEKESKENSETPEEKELKIKKQNEKDEAEKAAKEKEEAEKAKKENSKGDKMRFFKNLNTLRDEAQGKKENAVKKIGTLSDRLAKGKARFGATKSAKK